MKSELDRSKASFKLDLIETANADPMLSPADFKLLSAYVAVMAWPSCKAWLAAPLARAMTGLSERQFRYSRDVLRGENDAKRKYLQPARQDGKVAVYRLVNPWRDGAIAHVDAMTGHFREVERQKKAATRSVLSLQNLPGHEAGCPGKICRSVPAKSAAYTPLMITPRKKGVRGKDNKEATVVHLKDVRRGRSS